MSWKAVDTMSLKLEFVSLAGLPGANMRQLARRFNISPTTAYKWKARFYQEGKKGLQERSRRPRTPSGQTSTTVEQLILKVRDQHPAWGARKLRRRLRDLGYKDLPALSTITEILRRNGLLHLNSDSREQRDLQRFERKAPNELWQMDFKGDFPVQQQRCYPLTLIDDHSRYCVGIASCEDQSRQTVQQKLTRIFTTHGLPWAILADNGPPWGSASAECPVTQLGIWFWRLGIDLIHGRPYHPQTQGKLERFHRTLKAEVLTRPRWPSMDCVQEAFDHWRPVYNFDRPHQALDGACPSSRYYNSPRSMPLHLPPLEYDQQTVVRRVAKGGALSFRNQFYYVGRGFAGMDIGLIQTATDGVYDVYFGWKKLGRIDRREAKVANNVPISIWLKHKKVAIEPQ